MHKICKYCFLENNFMCWAEIKRIVWVSSALLVSNLNPCHHTMAEQVTVVYI
jgi:hypothetical protein